MPRQHTVPDIQLGSLADRLVPTIDVLNELNDAFAPPFIQHISNTVASLLELIQNVKQNKRECVQLLENINQVLYAIIELHVKSETTGSLPPEMTYHVGKFTKTIHKIYAYIEAQQDSNKIKQLFRYNETKNLLKDSRAEVEEAKEIFKVITGAAIFQDIGDMKKVAETKHQELLDIISTMCETSTTTDGSLLKFILTATFEA
ncbi:hypothetical protein MSAN_01823400 [Mycena sanguinolenta]|uniref:Uncharacterized protein n=1 Tax=Mycena sanguinolenta TaxID=230812 RepID=A0A8H7CSQ3_9AGAR|nr:hypothetical protein MSAN_01823400 [Mycena sanguinolenta]